MIMRLFKARAVGLRSRIFGCILVMVAEPKMMTVGTDKSQKVVDEMNSIISVSNRGNLQQNTA